MGQAGRDVRNRNPANTDEVVGLFRKGTAAGRRGRRGCRGRGASRRGRHERPGARATSCIKAADILDRKFEQIAADMTREEGKTLPEAKGEVRRSIKSSGISRAKARACRACWCRRERDRVHMFAHPQADRRGGADHAVEFPERDSGVETRAGADLRQHGGGEAGVGGAAERVADRRGAARGGRRRRAW